MQRFGRVDKAGDSADATRAGALRTGDALIGLQVRELGPDDLGPLNRDGKLLFNVNTPDDYLSAVAFATADDLDA